MQEKIDIIGDVHGCSWELRKLLSELGYIKNPWGWSHPEERQVAFIGDMVDRGPDSVGVIYLLQELIRDGVASIAAIGDHDYELYQGMILGNPIKVYFGLEVTLQQIRDLGQEKSFARVFKSLFEKAPSWSIVGNAALVHAAFKKEMLDNKPAEDWGGELDQFAFCGEEVEAPDEAFPRKGYRWVEEIPGDILVVHGHDVTGSFPVVRSSCSVTIDTGASYGGRLTAFRLPEKEFVSVSSSLSYPEHKDDFEKETGGSCHRVSFEEAQKMQNQDLPTLNFLHGSRKTKEMDVPKNILVEI